MAPQFEKERLIEDSIQLKKQLNFVNSENVRLKTKINLQDKELQRQNEILEQLNKKFSSEAYMSQNKANTVKKIHLLQKLKHNIKEQKVALKLKEDEILQLRKNIKSTKNFELEIEIKGYKDECTRLRHLLEEAFRGRLGVMPEQEDMEHIRDRAY